MINTLYLLRKIYTDKVTIGSLIIGDVIFCNTLEDTCRRPDLPKIYGETAISEGRYEIIINWSNKFKRQLPLLINVPNFEGIRIHGGNTEKDTEGCILVAYKAKENSIYNTAELDVTHKITSLLVNGNKVFIEIINTSEFYKINNVTKSYCININGPKFILNTNYK